MSQHGALILISSSQRAQSALALEHVTIDEITTYQGQRRNWNFSGGALVAEMESWGTLRSGV